MEEEEFNITDSDSESASSFLQIVSKLQLMLHNNSKPEPELDWIDLVLLDNQSILDFICNNRFTSEVNKYKTKLRL